MINIIIFNVIIIMLKSEVIVSRNKKILSIYKNKYSDKIDIINQYERQINYYKDKLCKKDLIVQKNVENVENIMIVAHPDDETIFGSNELYNNEKWLLIVCTNSVDGRVGLNKKNIPGLIQMSKDYKFNLIVIEHFDMYEENIINTRFDSIVYNYLKIYLMKQSWNKIITHNNNGEYGHTQHIIVHRMVSNILYNNDVVYNKFKVFDFNDKIINDINMITSNMYKYYLMPYNKIKNLKSENAYSKDTNVVNYNMTNLLCTSL